MKQVLKLFVKIADLVLFAGVFGLFAMNLLSFLLFDVAPTYADASWSYILVGLLVLGQLTQLAKIRVGEYRRKSDLFVAIGLLGLGMAVDLYVFAAVLAGFAVPHLIPLWVVLGYWLVNIGERVYDGVIEQMDGGVLDRQYVDPADTIRQQQEVIAQLTASVAQIKSPDAQVLAAQPSDNGAPVQVRVRQEDIS